MCNSGRRLGVGERRQISAAGTRLPGELCVIEHCGTLQPVKQLREIAHQRSVRPNRQTETTSHKTNIIPFLKSMFMCKEKPIRIGRVCTEKIKNV